MPIIRSRPGRLAMLVALPLVIATTAGALAASPGTMPFNTAAIRWILDAGTLESVESRQGLPADYQPTSVLYHFCLPPGDSETNTQASGTFDIAPDGAMTGTCHADRTTSDAAGTYVTVKDGTITGQYDLAAQTITFHFEGTTQEVYTPPATCNGANCGPIPYVYGIVIDGPVTGGEVIGDRADGTARHTFTCSAAAGVCFITQQVATGAFFFQFMPALPSQGPAPGGGTGGGTSDSNFILLLILAGASAAIIAAATLFLRNRKRRGPGPTAAAPRQTSPVGGGSAAARSASSDPSGLVNDVVSTAGELISPESGTGAAPANAASGMPADGTVTPPSPGQDITPADVAALGEVVDPGGALMPRGTDTPSDTFDPKADVQASDDLNFLEVSAKNAELEGKFGADDATKQARGSDGPPRPPTPGKPGTLNLEGEGWAGTRAESPDEFAEGWVTNTGVIGSPGSARKPPPDPETAIKEEATNILDSLDPGPPKPPPKVDPNA